LLLLLLHLLLSLDRCQKIQPMMNMIFLQVGAPQEGQAA
jgi:hypothetical protein